MASLEPGDDTNHPALFAFLSSAGWSFGRHYEDVREEVFPYPPPLPLPIRLVLDYGPTVDRMKVLLTDPEGKVLYRREAEIELQLPSGPGWGPGPTEVSIGLRPKYPIRTNTSTAVTAAHALGRASIQGNRVRGSSRFRSDCASASLKRCLARFFAAMDGVNSQAARVSSMACRSGSRSAACSG